VLTVTAPPAPINDNCSGAIALTVGTSFVSNPVVGTNVGATTQAGAPLPTCGAFNYGGEVWYSVVVPASGSITIETQSNSGSPISDTVMDVFSGTCTALVAVECDDDDGTGSFSIIALTGRTPGEVLYVRVWEYANDAVGTFQVSAYDVDLSSPGFDDSNFKFYPNPVTDILNLSYSEMLTNVEVFNMIGQQVVSKKLNSNTGQIDMSQLPSGTYVIKVSSDDTSKVFKVIKR
jgi:hypothetical protein